MKKEQYEFYQTSTDYLAKLQNHNKEYFVHYVETLKKYVPPHSRILDLGCGIGVSTSLLYESGYDVIGLDISPLFVKSAYNKDKIKYIVGDAQSLPFKAESFDAVASIEVLEHLYHPDQALKEMKRILKVNGLLIILTPNFLCPLRPLIYKMLKRELPYNVSSINLLKGNLKRVLAKEPIFEFKDPTGTGGDKDAVFLSNPYDIKIWLHDNGFKIIQEGRGFVSKIPLIRNLAFGVHLVAKKMN